MYDKKIRIADIARTAGVSNATISRVLNNPNIVNDETYKKVITAMNSLGYNHEISMTTTTNKDKLNDLIILTVPSIDNHFYNEIAKGAQSAAMRFGYHLLIDSTHLDGDDLNRFIRLIKNNNVAGVITLNSLTASALEKICSVTNVVQCCEYCENYDASYVSIDDYHATKSALHYLLSKGRKKIAFVNGPTRYKYARHRKKGYTDFLAENGLAYCEDWIIQLSDINYDMAVAAITQLLSKENRPDAIFGVSDVYASAGIKVAKKCGLNVPKDLMIIGFDNINVSIMSEPAITTINQPKIQMGYMACELLFEQINNPNAPKKHILLDTELIIRESTID